MAGMTVERLRERVRVRAAHRDRTLVGIAETLEGAVALEPGGPSAIFDPGGQVPIYRRLAALDILDYAEHTLWSQNVGAEIQPRRRVISEAGCLDEIPDEAYDALLASHVLEHLANPLGALAEWRRVVRPGGHLLLVVPHRDGTFDHRRPVTTIEHLQEDAAHGTREDALTHLPEILQLHDLDRDPGAPSREGFEQRCRDNSLLRGMHHHVFVSRTVVEVCRAAGLNVMALQPKRPFHIVCLCRVGADGGTTLDDHQLADILRSSPFASDRGIKRRF